MRLSLWCGLALGACSVTSAPGEAIDPAWAEPSAPDGGAPLACLPGDKARCAGDPVDSPADFIDDVRVLFQAVTCQPGPVPAPLDPKAVARYCAEQSPRFERFQEHWGTKTRAFLSALRPADAPSEVLYPFGGGDLMMALVAFPHATTVTTLSLELAGDPRRIRLLSDAAELQRSLRTVAHASATTLVSNDSLSVRMSQAQRGELPGQLSMHLIGLALNGFEPVSVRYFRFEPSGELHYFTHTEIAALEGLRATAKRATWRSPDFSPAFANVEVQFVPAGQPDAPRRTHRHIGADLSNEGLERAPEVLAHLRGRGRVSMMTKAASYLLWNEGFSTVRDLIVGNAAFMVSDSTGVPPRWWKKAGCTVETYGTFRKAFLRAWVGYEEELRREFELQPFRQLPTRFGYPDGSPQKRSHLVAVRCEAAATPETPETPETPVTPAAPAKGG